MGYNICGLIVSKISGGGGGGGGEYSQINLFETTPVQYSVWQQYGLLLCPNCGKTIGANCTNMVGTLTIRRLLSPVLPDGNFH